MTHEAAIDKLSANTNLALLYGSDIGYVAVLVARLLAKLLGGSDDPFRKIQLNYAAVKADPSLLAEEMGSLTLFGEQKIIIIENCGDSLTKDIITLIQALKKQQAFLIFVGGELRKGGSTRAAFEGASNALVLPCYKNDLRASKVAIAAYLTEYGLQANSGILDALASLLCHDRMVLYSELSKLCLYKGDAQTIEEDDLLIISSSDELALDELCASYALQDKRALSKYISIIEDEGVNFMLVIRVLLKYFMRLVQVKGDVVGGASLDRAMLRLYPQVFYKQKDSFIKVVNRLTVEEMLERFSKLLTLEATCKTITVSPELLLCNFLLQ